MSNFLTNHYDILYKEPKTEKEDLFVELEELAQKLVKSGLLRISDDEKCNFVIYPVQGGKIHLNFSKRELFEKNLLEKTRKILAENLSYDERKNTEESVERKIDILRNKLKKYIEVDGEFEVKIARLLVQSAHFAVISNLIDDGVKIFVSVHHNISDLLDVQTWKTSRSSQGLQSTDYKNTGVFVSMGGNPFYDPKESNNESDGFKAQARLQIVAAQEIAHYADLRKDNYGNVKGRFSSKIDMSAPDKLCNELRIRSIEKIDTTEAKLVKCGIKKLYDIEQRLKIQRKYRKFSTLILYLYLRKRLSESFFKSRILASGLNFYKNLKDQKFLAEEILKCLGDMKFNLEPKSSAYRDDDKNIEEAIACAEALARIPQQELKWGEEIVKYFCDGLQKFYYEKVVQQEISRHEFINKKKFEVPKTKYKKPLMQMILEK